MVVSLTTTKRQLAAACLAAIALSLAARYIAFSLGEFDLGMFASFARFDSLAVGALLALGISPRRGFITFLTYAAVLALLSGRLAYFSGLFQVTTGFLYTALICAVVISYRDWIAWILSLRPLVYLGRRSYGLYLIHPLVFFVIDSRLPGIAAWQFVILGLGLTFTIAELSWRWLEKPVLDLQPTWRRLGRTAQIPVSPSGWSPDWLFGRLTRSFGSTASSLWPPRTTSLTATAVAKELDKMPIFGEISRFAIKTAIVSTAIILIFVAIATIVNSVIEARLAQLQAAIQTSGVMGGRQLWTKVERQLDGLAEPQSDLPPEKKQKILSDIQILSDRWRPFVQQALSSARGEPKHPNETISAASP